MLRIFITLFIFVLGTCCTSAVPAKRVSYKERQPDGTVLTLTVRGDENFHFACTVDGLPVVQRRDGAYCYARRSADGSAFEPTAQLAHDVASRSVAEDAFVAANASEFAAVRSIGSARAAERNAARMARLARRSPAQLPQGMMRQQMAGATGGDGIGVKGRRKGLVILVDFSDVKMQAGHDNAEWTNFFNQEGYANNGNAGSVHDYFYAQSYGQFDLAFDVVGPVTVSRDMAYYGGNDKYGNDKNPAAMVYEACQLADPYVDFADYDWDGDGEADQVFVVYAGYGEASSPKLLANTIWPHEWNLSSAKYNLVLDGVKVSTYGCSQELDGYQGTTMAGIGTACHEFTHCMGIPDIYDTQGSNYGMDEWDLMDYGSYGGDGYCPVGYNTYERWVSGWLQPTTLGSACSVSGMKALGDSPEAYVVYNDHVPTEYYILENRQQTGFDASLPAHGMLVIHVDYDESAWTGNKVNVTSSHQRFSIVPADNDLSGRSAGDYCTNAGDTYPGTSGNTSLTDESEPAATLFNANADGRRFLGKPITDIRESADGLISFSFMANGKVGVPRDMQSRTTSLTSFDASWAAAGDADSYTLQIRKTVSDPSAGLLLLAEDFTSWGKGLSTDGNTDISASLDSHMSNRGWTGARVYAGPGRLKMGTTRYNSQLTSPLLANLSGDAVSVGITSGVYGTDKAEVIVTLLDGQGSKIDAAKVVPDGSKCMLRFDNPGHEDCRVMIQPAKRCYLYSVAIYGDTADGAESVGGITATSHAFASLDEGATYQWRVQAVSGGRASEWSAWQTVDLSGYGTGIGGILADGRLTASRAVTVYSPNGTQLGCMTYASFLASDMRSGLYILMCGGKAYKVVKR